MIVYRAVQGFIGGGMIPTAFAAAYTVFPKRAQGMVMALVGLTVTLAPTIGPTVGGYPDRALLLALAVSRQRRPRASLATVIAWILVDFDEPDYALLRRFDFVGLADDGGLPRQPRVRARGGAAERLVRTTATILLLAVARRLAGVVFFCAGADRGDADRRPPAFLDRNFAVGSALTFVLGIGLYGLTYLYPLFLARVRGYPSLQIGETVFVTGAFMFLAAPVVGMLARKTDPRRLIFVGLVGFAVSSFDLTRITADWAFWELFSPQALRGVALMSLHDPDQPARPRHAAAASGSRTPRACST